MENFEELTCTLCLNSILDKSFEAIEDVTRYTLSVIGVKLNIDDKQKNIMCGSCSVKLYSAFDFKSACISANDTVVPYVNLKKTPVDLREIYVKERGINLSDDQKICRLCLQPTREEYVSIHEVEVDLLQRYIPEVNFEVTTDPVICKFCLDTLNNHTTFIKNCSHVEKNVKNTFLEKPSFLDPRLAPSIESEQSELEETKVIIDSGQTGSHFVAIKEERIEEVVIKTEDVEIKSNDFNELSLPSSQRSKIFIKSETLIEDNSTTEHSLNTYDQDVNKFKCECCAFTTKSVFEIERHILTHKDESEAVLCTPEHDVNSKNQSEDSLKLLKHVCDVCGFRTKRKRNLINHKLSHKDDSEIPWYKCNLCDHKSKWKYSLKNHMLTHKTASEREWYHCNLCDHKSNDKIYLKRHMITHKDASDIQWFACDVCEYKSKTKHRLKEHKLIHKDASEIQWHACELCDYKSKMKGGLRAHMLIHIDDSKIQWHGCQMCDYKSKTKGNLRAHMLVHINVSETQWYKCDLCDHKSNTKDHLKEHMVVHKKVDELYLCHLCDHKARTKTDLKRHFLIHKNASEMEWYKCEVCDYKSEIKWRVRKHMLVHQNSSVLNKPPT